MLGLLFNVLAVAFFSTGFFAAPPEALVYKFQAGFDGFGPRAGLIADSAGNLYGTTFDGGGSAGAGTVFRLAPPTTAGGKWTETVIHRFSYHSIQLGISPWGGVAGDRAGDLFGTAWLGGNCGSCGLVFELSPLPNGKWRYKIIHDFVSNGVDGINPQADVSIDAKGDLFGTTASGGRGRCMGGCGTVWELSPTGDSWTETILRSFPAHGSGESAYGGTGGGVVVDGNGNVYGTSLYDGGGLGNVFKLSRSPGGQWTYRELYAFQSFADGAVPSAGVTLDGNGDLFGTTLDGGVQGCYGSGCGTVFKLTRTRGGQWIHTIVYAFAGTGDGGTPSASVLVRSTGAVYGTTQLWGVGNGCPISGCGVAFRLNPSANAGAPWTQTVLHTFRNDGEGFVPYGGLIFGPGALIYGATQFGGKSTCDSGFGCGTVYSLVP